MAICTTCKKEFDQLHFNVMDKFSQYLVTGECETCQDQKTKQRGEEDV